MSFQAIPEVNSSAWPLLNSSVLMFCLSLVACCVIHEFDPSLRGLAFCTSMHLVAKILASYVDVALRCPLPPIFMPDTAATGMGLALGMLLLCISQMHVSPSQFYMNHVWACFVAVLAARHVLFRAATWVLCWAQGAWLRESVEEMMEEREKRD